MGMGKLLQCKRSASQNTLNHLEGEVNERVAALWQHVGVHCFDRLAQRRAVYKAVVDEEDCNATLQHDEQGA
jgi:hypothetical protein